MISKVDECSGAHSHRWLSRLFLLAFIWQMMLPGIGIWAAVPAPVLMNSRSSSNVGTAPASAAKPSSGPMVPIPAMPTNLSGGAGTTSGGQLLGSPDAAYQISATDVIEIRVFGQSTMDTVTRVDTRGFLNFPPVGQVKVLDLTERQVETLLEDRLRLGFLQDPHVSAFVREMHPSEVAIIGEIKSPGRYPYLFGCRTLVELLARSGGMTDKAGGVAYIMRFDNPQWVGSTDFPSSTSLTIGGQGVKRLAVDLNELLITGKVMNIALKAGDIVTIPDAGYVHITGTGLIKPGVYPLRRAPNNLEQFIDEAGGFKFEANKKKIMLIRGATSGEPGMIEKFNYDKLLDRKIPEIILKPDDKVIVVRSTPKYILASIGRGISAIFNFSAYASVPVAGK